jgi:nucleoside-diphosphate-sugar epimerase
VARVLVTGGSSLVGRFLVPRLLQRGHEVHVLSRRQATDAAASGGRWHVADIAAAAPDLALGAFRVVHLAPLWLLPPLLPAWSGRGLERVVAFGSTSRFTKLGSADAGERQLARALQDAEQRVVSACTTHGVVWTLLRPTLIYGAGKDANLTRIAGVIRRLGFFPLPSGACGRRQPVHADDLAQAAVEALERPAAANRAYDLSGGSTLTYREMVEGVFAGLGRRPRILAVPRRALRAGLRLLALVPGADVGAPALIDRMLEDLCFDHAEATRDLDFRPRPFAYPG